MRKRFVLVLIVVVLLASLPFASSAGDRPLDLNRATFEQIVGLPGIGPAIAQRIIDYREKKGGFSSVDELLNIKGIGPKRFEKIRHLITVGPLTEKGKVKEDVSDN